MPTAKGCVKVWPRISGILLLLGFVLAMLSDELESRRTSAISECLGQYFPRRAERGNQAAHALVDACKSQHGLDDRFRWDNPALHLLAFPACEYRNGWANNCLLSAAPS